MFTTEVLKFLDKEKQIINLKEFLQHNHQVVITDFNLTFIVKPGDSKNIFYYKSLSGTL